MNAKEKILIICRHERWCVTWFNQLLRFLAYGIKITENDGSIMVNKRHKCICIPQKEIIFASESEENNKIKGSNPNRVIHWDGNDINELWNLI